MYPPEVEQLAKQMLDGTLALDAFVQAVAQPMSAQFDEVTLDLDRHRRCGFPEVVYGEGKNVETIARIFQRLLEEGVDALATRVDAEKAEHLLTVFPGGLYNASGRTFRVQRAGDDTHAPEKVAGRVAVITAGTSDLPVAEEARETLDWMGVEVSNKLNAF